MSIGGIIAGQMLYGNHTLFEIRDGFFDKIFLDLEMSGYNRCECRSILEHYIFENPLYKNQSLLDDFEIIAKLQLYKLENQTSQNLLLSYIKNSPQKQYLSFAHCKSCNNIYSKIDRRIKCFCGIKYSDKVTYEKIDEPNTISDDNLDLLEPSSNGLECIIPLIQKPKNE